MALILNIDTSTETASASIANNGEIILFITNAIQKEHATFLHSAIKDLLQEAAIDFKSLDAIAVTEGPGSYTGLRIGMAAAKGLAFALNKPFITIGTLAAMAHTGITTLDMKADLYCPMIDARRMEVYSAIYSSDMTEVSAPHALILTEESLAAELKTNKIAFLGSGMPKWKALTANSNCFFIEEMNYIPSIAQLSFQKFREGIFTELAHSQPLYVKEFYNSK